MLEAIKTAIKLPDLRKKLIWTLVLLGIFRLGSLVPIPGPWDLKRLGDIFKGNSVFGLLDMMAGGGLANMSVFAMSVNPYITASIIMQLLTMVIPQLEQMAKEGGEGRKIIAQYTRYATVVLAIIQGTALAFGLRAAMIAPTVWDIVLAIITLTTGAVLLMWLGEVLSERGIGNGISMIIFAGIVARVFPSIKQLFDLLRGQSAIGLTLVSIILFIALIIAVVAGVVFVTQGERKIPVQYAKRIVGRKMYGGTSTYLPIKVNHSGVIPVIFASSILAFPPTIAQFLEPGHWLYKALNIVAPGRTLYLIIYAILIFLFTYFYTAITFNPLEVSDNMKKYGGFIPGIRPGKPTAEYLDRVLTRITLAGALFLTVIALLPYLINLVPAFKTLQVQFGGTAVLIAVGVAIDTMKQIEAQLLMRQYEGFLK
ncbi:MAG TPA: preprotein translocase subunit SecY [Bacillota bacterium]|nr:preprotein translocase subunit SecY [Bacillota bacterium]HOL08982.1 preprotein translocase subunit SecY [Bacillota bacterium]HPO96464.1 preprotein translocase subunit SecY [Bacillota bacterium]